ncbi:MAG: threonyl-tRNA synthetase editing domain-containing protein [Promethearchaeota archaeon]
MRLLLIHAKSMKYRPTKPVKISVRDEVQEELQWTEIDNVLVAFAAVEKIDENSKTVIVEKACAELKLIVDRVKAERILIYPYAHLFSSKLGSPRAAIDICKGLEKELTSMGFEVTRAPFGWYKEFVLHCLGHPLSESSRTITP